MSKTVFINGANGFLAPHIIAKYLENGYSVVAAARSKDDLTAEKRVADALNSVNKGREVPLDLSRVEVVDMGVLGDPGEMAEKIDSAVLKLNPEGGGRISDFILNAAVVDMSANKAEGTFNTNVLGMDNMLDVVARLNKAPELVINVSTAYSADMGEPGATLSSRKGIAPRGDYKPENTDVPYDFGEGGSYTYSPDRDGARLNRYANPYAQSKAAADAVFRRKMSELKDGGRCIDTRIVTVSPGLVLGEGSDFGPASIMPVLESSAPLIGTYLEQGGPLYISQNPDSEVNSMRVEDVASNIVGIAESMREEAPGTVEGAFHITNSQNLTYEELLRNMFLSVGIREDLVEGAQFKRVRDIKSAYGKDDEVAKAISMGMVLAERGLKHYGKILRDWDVHMDPEGTKRFLESHGLKYHESEIGPDDFSREPKSELAISPEGQVNIPENPLPVS